MPDLFLSQPMINRVYNWYLASFRDLIESPTMVGGVSSAVGLPPSIHFHLCSLPPTKTWPNTAVDLPRLCVRFSGGTPPPS
jgi:hypothetical protein